MSEDKIYLFTTSICPACPPAKEYVKASELEDKVEVIIADKSLDAMTLAESFGIASVPTFVIVKEDKTFKKMHLPEFKLLNL